MKYLFVLIFVLIYSFFGKELGYSKTSPFYTHFTYLFQHANIFHLLINSISFIGIFRLLEKVIKRGFIIIMAVYIAIGVSFFTAMDLPTVGASGMIYVMIGMYVGAITFSPRFSIGDPKKYTLFLSAVVLAITISSIIKTSNHLLHALSYLTGMVAGFIAKDFRAK